MDELIFDPTMIVGESTAGEKRDDKKEEKLNLFKDKIFDDPTEDKKTDLEDGKKSDEGAPSKDIKKDESSQPLGFSVVLGQDLMERGVLSSFNEEEIAKIAKEEGEDVAIAKMIELQTEAINNELKSSYDNGYQEYLSLVQGGVPKEDAIGINQLENYSNSLKDVDLKSEENLEKRKNLLAMNYILTTRWSEDKIQKYIEKAIDEGTDLDEVDDALTNLNAYVAEEKQNLIEVANQQKLQAKQAQEKMVNDYKSYIQKTDEYFSGEKISKDMKSKLEKSLLDPVKLNNGTVTNKIWAKRASNPISFDAKIAYLNEIGFFDDKPLDKFIKKAETKVTTKMADYLNDNKGRDFMKSFNKSFSKEEAGKVDFLDML